MRAEMRPTYFCISVRASFFSSKEAISASSLPKARSTRTPVRFSLVVPSTLSSRPCTFLYRGMLRSMMPNTTTDSTGMANANHSAACASMVKAMIMAPNTTKGERKSSRKARFSPVCTWFMSLVMRVIRVEMPTLSSV